MKLQIPSERKISDVIFSVRGMRVILDADVAAFFERSTGEVNQSRKRNAARFPDSYAFQLTAEEWANLKSQFVISSSHGGRRTRPWAYSEHGFSMLSMSLRGPLAAQMSRVIVDTFVSFRQGRLSGEPVLVGPNAPSHRETIRSAIVSQIQALLAMQVPGNGTVGQELQTITERAANSMTAILEQPKRKDELMLAEIAKLEAETAKLYAEAQRLDVETASLWMDVFQKRLAIVRDLRDMAAQIERDQWVDALQPFGGSIVSSLPKS